jgi:hypothetical protein
MSFEFLGKTFLVRQSIFLSHFQPGSFYHPSPFNHPAKEPKAQRRQPWANFIFEDPEYHFKDKVSYKDRSDPLEIAECLFTDYRFLRSEPP